MNEIEFRANYNKWVEAVNAALSSYVVEKNSPEGSIYSAMRYSLMAGGKRLRPVLSLAVCEVLEGNVDDIMPFACAIEMIHTYSLIHDDLPAMDNDDYRRGRLTNHKVFGEAKAILAGDALLNYAFEVMLDDTAQTSGGLLTCAPLDGKESSSSLLTRKVGAIKLIAKASGVSGMIGGQIVDLESEGRAIDSNVLVYMHECKTGALIKSAVMSSARVCGANEEEISRLEYYSEKIGLAFQIKDDILDVEGNFKMMGKSAGSDEANLKSTFVTLHGLEKSKHILENITNEAVESLNMFGERAGFLKQLAFFIAGRES